MLSLQHHENGKVCVIDADDLLDDPTGIVRAYCEVVGLEFSPDMLRWDTKADKEQAARAFDKWKGFHEDAINSTDLKPRVEVRTVLLTFYAILHGLIIQLSLTLDQIETKNTRRGWKDSVPTERK